MRVALPSAVLLALGLAFSAPAVAAKPKARATVGSVSTSVRAVAPGEEVTARVILKPSRRGRVAPAKVGLVLAAGTKPKGGIALTGKPATARLGRRGTALSVTATVPATVAEGRVLRVLACIGAARAVARGAPRGGCRVARGALRIAAPSGTGSIDAAVAAGTLDRATATLYRLYALAGDPRLPARFAGAVGDADGHGAISEAAASFPSLPRALQRKVIPFFAPPAARNSAWGGKAHKPRKRRKRARSSQEGPVNCNGFSSLTAPEDWTGQYVGHFDAVGTADGKAWVHYIKWTPIMPNRYGTPLAHLNRNAAEMNEPARSAAQRFARVLPGIWSKLTAEFGEPQGDAGVTCYNGGDGRFDVYVDTAGIIRANQPGASALTLPYPQVAAFCTNRPAFIIIAHYEEPWTLAHEFMHALQFAHRYQSCAEPISFWDEGGANWAADFVYPDVQREQTKYPHAAMIKDPLGASPLTTDYDFWPFWMMLHRNHGTGVLRDIFGAMASAPAIDAIDRAVPGGWREQLPRLLIHLWNKDPVGAPGFPVATSFKDWDRFSGTPPVPPRMQLALNGAPEATIKVTSHANAAGTPLVMGALQEITIADDQIRELRFKNGGHGQGVHVDAALHLADGSWKLADWSGREETTLCRDKPEEDVRELIVFSTSVSTTRAVSPTHELHGRDECAPPRYAIDAVEYTDQLALTGLTGYDECTNPSTDQTHTSTLGGPVPDEPGGALSPPYDGGKRTGLMHALITVRATAAFRGCTFDENGGHYIHCNAQGTGSAAWSLVVELELPPGDVPAKLTWHPRYSYVGEYPPPPSTMCGGFDGGAQVFDATTTTAPRSALLDPGPQVISVDLNGSAPNDRGDGTVHSTARYTVRFHRINEDGTPYQG